MLTALLVSPPYIAVMECAPTCSEETTSVASPCGSSATVPRTAAPSPNVIVPVGIPAVVPFTVAERVIGVPKATSALLETSAVVVADAVTNCDRTGEAPLAELVSPP